MLISYSAGSGGSIATSSDVALSNPGNGQLLTFKSSTSKWTNSDAPSEKVTTVTSAGTTQTLTVPANGKATYVLTGTASSCTLTVSGATADIPVVLTLWLKQDSSGNRGWTFPNGTIYPSHTAPTLSTTANYVDVVTLTSADGGSTWLLVPAATQAG